jgi:succinoglycan biosynthesis transport protein ExoP
MDSITYARFNIMFLGEKPFMPEIYWQVAREYKGRVLRLSILITILALLIVNTVPPTYIGSARLQFLPLKSALVSGVSPPFLVTDNQQELHSRYEKVLSENIAKGVLIKLKKFRLIDLDSELKKVISEHVIVNRIKQKIRSVLPFMPQQDSEPLSSKQLASLKNNYTLEQVIQNLHLRYSLSQNKVYIDYKDQRSAFAIIIARLATDLYVQSVSETKMQLFDHVLGQIKQNNQSYELLNTLEPYETSYRELQIHDIESSIVFISQKIKKLNKQVKDSSHHWQEMIFIKNKLRKYGFSVALLLKHEQITGHALIQPFKQNVEIAEMKLNYLTQLPEQVSSQIAVAMEELMLETKMLDWQLVLFASNLESYLFETRHELDKLKSQLTVSQQNLQNLTRLQKKLNQFSASFNIRQTHKLQDKLNQIASFAPTLSTDTEILISKYTTRLLKPNRILIVSLSFFLSILVTSLLVLILECLKVKDRQKNLSPMKNCVDQ